MSESVERPMDAGRPYRAEAPLRAMEFAEMGWTEEMVWSR